MKPKLWALPLLALIALRAHAAVFEFAGTAFDRGNALYREHHRVDGACIQGMFAPRDHNVNYFKQEGDVTFATKQLTYLDTPFRPEVLFHQPLFGERLQITYPKEQSLSIAWQPPSGHEKAFSVEADPALVVDSGFDHFVRANWERIVAGESITFRFLAPTRGDHYGFVLEPANSDQIDADVTIQIRPTSVLLRLLVDPILLGYRADGALTDYFGLTNIRRDEDANHVAHIRYQVVRLPGCELTP